ncbi:hypothetical protein KCL53_002843 [Clostridium perfringens]|uniref:hypothetical protein n=1 Tax=Clostridium perfringens TaxID=1502 RepID=UPI001DF1D68D|nr:hypothetical protein [Clostridium perfringens]EHK2349676.1 hypothetical protein [Clostridium perfringens]EJT6155047.1 hypothetical protein [Clostridium perfringens]MCX0366257.1 hypothetical protein [Clostridium perfringens]MCX0381638.1 hypothetical protein [Clostridium perfringens]MDT7918744.1 hypothetical protein [Clostridium perfringens]
MENTMKKYTSTMMPMAARSFFINVKQDEKGCFYGTINEIFYQYEIEFQGLDDAILKIDSMLDELGCVQASTELRSFIKKEKKSEDSNLTMDERIKAERKRKTHTQYREIEDLKRNTIGQINNYIVDIDYRQNSSWQGKITWWICSGKSKKEYFRSVLELLKLIQSSFDSSAKGK